MVTYTYAFYMKNKGTEHVQVPLNNLVIYNFNNFMKNGQKYIFKKYKMILPSSAGNSET